MNLVLHHNDSDGISAGAICDYALGGENRLYSINYGYDTPWNLIKRAKKVYMVDFGIQPFSDMLRIQDMVGYENFIWIDHHKTSIDDMEASGREFKGIQRIGESGCELTWEYFFEGQQMPRIIRMIGRYDVWDLEYSEDLMNIQEGLKYFNPDAEDRIFWEQLFEDTKDERYYNEILDRGRVCNTYKMQNYEKYCNSHSFYLEWEGLRFLAVNALNVNSTLFDTKFNHNDYDAMLCFGYTNKNWSVSMYTDKPGIDVGAIAKRYGGGGHIGACGFQVYGKDLPFEMQWKNS